VRAAPEWLFSGETGSAQCGTTVAEASAMRFLLRLAVTKRILDRAPTVMACLAFSLSVVACSADSGAERSVPKLTLQQDAGCESADLDDSCSAIADDESAGEELNRDELERELDRIEQEIGGENP
jgi:hypothetical protein